MTRLSMLKYQQRIGHRIAHLDSTLIVLFDRPEKSNALDVETCSALSQTLDQFAADPSLQVAILGGNGRHGAVS